MQACTPLRRAHIPDGLRVRVHIRRAHLQGRERFDRHGGAGAELQSGDVQLGQLGQLAQGRQVTRARICPPPTPTPLVIIMRTCCAKLPGLRLWPSFRNCLRLCPFPLSLHPPADLPLAFLPSSNARAPSRTHDDQLAQVGEPVKKAQVAELCSRPAFDVEGGEVRAQLQRQELVGR